MARKFLFKTTAAAAIAVMMSVGLADARPGGGGSVGSRGGRTYSAPPATNTAPSGTTQWNRTVTPSPSPSYVPPYQQPGGFGRAAPQTSMLRNIATGFGIGLIGSGLIGMFTGSGFFGGMGSFMGMIGFLIQMALIFFVVRFVINMFRRRQDNAQPAGYARSGPDPFGAGNPMAGPMAGGMMGGVAGSGMANARPAQPSDALGLSGADFDTFERMLGQIQSAYGQEDLNALRGLATPEMVSYFADDLAANSRKGVINRISDVKMLQGDLSEAWREADGEYATVALRYSLVDVTVDRASGRVVDGSPRPQQVSELWTFRRAPGAPWQLSAIQQTG